MQRPAAQVFTVIRAFSASSCPAADTSFPRRSPLHDAQRDARRILRRVVDFVAGEDAL
jgi:hypothetical protein